MRIVTSQQMKEIEKNALAYDLTFARLMENAGSAAGAFIRRTFPLRNLNCMVFCGKGNNGGDGLVVARKLYENEANVVVVLVNGVPKSEEAAGMYESVRAMGIPIFLVGRDNERIESCIAQSDLVVDAIYGTGFCGKLPEAAAYCCGLINSAIAAVIALDIPSGIEADSGRADLCAVRADFTVAFDSHKPAHMLPQTEELRGVVELVNIGIPEEAHAGVESRFGGWDMERTLRALPPRDPQAHKGTHGTLLAVCGSARYRGTAQMVAMAALRCGAGLCCLAAPEVVCASVAARLPEPVYLPLALGAGEEIDVGAALALLREQLNNSSAVVFGCGLGDSLETRELLDFVLENCDVPLVIDADGINALAKNIHVLQRRRGKVILTPHPGEMARLTGKPVAELQANRHAVAMEFAAKHQVVLVLKGHETLIALPDGGLYVNASGNAGLAKGGSGDLLAGMIGAFAAQGVEPGDAAASAVHLHGLAADRTAARLSQYGMLPHEILPDLAAIFAENGR